MYIQICVYLCVHCTCIQEAIGVNVNAHLFTPHWRGLLNTALGRFPRFKGFLVISELMTSPGAWGVISYIH